MRETTLRALDALGLGWGPAHLEMRLAPEGPTLIEVNPRLAGGFIPELVRLASGIDLVRQTIAMAAGMEPELTPPIRQAASIRFLLAGTEGRLQGAEGVEEARQLPGVCDIALYCQPEQRIVQHGDFRDRIGHVITSSPDVEACSVRAEEVRAMIRLIISPGG